MYIRFKNRDVDYSKPVLIYRNLHAKVDYELFSIQQNGLVVGHAGSIQMLDCIFIVRPAGRDKVRDTKHKNVHAFIKGHMNPAKREITRIIFSIPTCKEVIYNPFKNDTFVTKDEGVPVFYAKAADMDKYGVRAYGI
jgi:hypothetical protein